MTESARVTAAPSIWRRLWLWFLQTVGPRHFYFTFTPWVSWLTAIALGLLLVGSVWGLVFAPPDYLQGNSYRIIYIHVPAANLAMSIYLALAILGVIRLVWQIKMAEIVARAAAPVGFVVCVLSLLTGAIWGKPTWGTYWVWDGRLTSMLILAFLYAGVMALYQAFEHSPNQGKAAAILAVVGVVNLPIIKYSVDWWNTLHQGATFTVTEAPKMAASMWLPLLIMIVGFYVMAAALVLYRSCTLILQRERQSRWVQELVRQKGV